MARREFVEALRAAPAAPPGGLRYEEFEVAGHGEVMIALMSTAAVGDLPPICRDFVRSVCCEK